MGAAALVLMEKAPVVMEEGSGPDMEAVAILAAVAVLVTTTSVMVVLASMAWALSGTDCFSILFRSITRRIGGAAALTIMRMTISTNGMIRSVNMRPWFHRRISPA